MTEVAIKNLNKFYGKHHVLKNVSFSFRAGEIVGFIGPNGSGKSTTMKCIANLVFPEKNSSIQIAGFDLVKQRNHALAHLSALIEAPGLYFNLSGMDNLKLFARLQGVPRERLAEVIEFSGLGNALKKKAGDYSMGMKQRLALAVAILPDPSFLILDEPFNGLDPQGVFDLRKVIKDLAQEGRGILISSHQLLEVEKIATRNIFIKVGEIVPQDQSATGTTILSYRLLIHPEAGDLEILARLQGKKLLKDFEIGKEEIIITLADAKLCGQVLATILPTGREASIIPVVANIEDLYNRIYKPGA